MDLDTALYFQSELLQLGKCSLNADEFQAAVTRHDVCWRFRQIVEMIDVQNKFLLLRRGTSRTEVFWGGGKTKTLGA